MAKSNEIAALKRDTTELREIEALQLRLEGLPYDEIALRMGLSQVGVATLVKRGLERRVTELSSDVLQMELIRLDEAMRIAWELAANDRIPPMMRLQALDRVLKVQDRRTKYLGLDAPEKKQIDQTIHNDLDDRILEIVRAFGPPVIDAPAPEPPALATPDETAQTAKLAVIDAVTHDPTEEVPS